jgi:DNA-binding winged helix-turn-helix (wHTH) protein
MVDDEFNGILFFESFELNIQNRELTYAGSPIHLQLQPLKLLVYLALHAQETVTRETLKRHLWDTNTYVDYEAGLNYCIRQIRKALREDARRPRLLQTLSRQGYKFLAEVERLSLRPGTAPITGQRRITVTLCPHPGLEDGLVRLTEGIAQLLLASYRFGEESSSISNGRGTSTLDSAGMPSGSGTLTEFIVTTDAGSELWISRGRVDGQHLAVLRVE